MGPCDKQDALTMKDRLLVALCVSLALHLPLVLLFGWLPLPQGQRPAGAPEGGRPLSVTVGDWPQPRPKRPPPPIVDPLGGADAEVVTLPATANVAIEGPVIKPPSALPNRGTPSGNGGGPGGGGLLSAPATVRRVVYLVDRSASMGLSGKLERALKELQDALKELPPDGSFQVLFYNQGTQPLLPPTASGLLPSTPGTIDQAVSCLDDVYATGTTNHLSAFQAALYLRPEVLFLVTDADDLAPDHVRSITGLNRGRTRIHVIELSSAKTANAPLSDLARLNGGSYRRVAP
jgi:hypothetical protein